MQKTNTGLVAYCRAQLGRPYWYGTFGQISSQKLYERKKAQYPQYYTAKNFLSQLDKRVHDCAGLIKGYLWSETPTSPPVYNSAQDIGANTMLSICAQRGGIKSIPEIPGLLVFMDNHVGVYIGGGEVIEARGHAYGVVKTKLKDRPWKYWGRFPWISYEEVEKTVKIELKQLAEGDKGDIVKATQRLLVGYAGADGKPLTIDGEFGANTKKAVERFQKAKGLEVDGIVGEETWSALLKGKSK